MSKEHPGMRNLLNQLYRDQKTALELVRKRSPDPGFELAVRRLFGDNPERGKTVRIGNREFIYSNPKKNLVSFLPAQWQGELDKARDVWSGCENWWAGYPLIAWVEMQADDDRATWCLKLTAEVGPISNHKIRKGFIRAIKVAASANGLERIQFSDGAANKGRIYSRFFRDNSIVVSDIYNADLVKRRFVELIASFEREFELIANVIPQSLKPA